MRVGVYECVYMVCDGGRELSEPDRAELERFAAMLRTMSQAGDLVVLTREEACELVYGVEAPQTDKEA